MAIVKSSADRQLAGAERLLSVCGNLSAGERCLIVFDRAAGSMVEILMRVAKSMGAMASAVEIAELSMHGSEPPESVAQQMCGAQLVLGLTAKSMAHTSARQRACLAGARYLSLPEYSPALLEDKSLLADFIGAGARARRVADKLSNADSIRITTAKGTDIVMSSRGRIANCCPGYVYGPGQMGSPPDIEANVSPVETSSTGVAVIDGSIPHPELGLLHEAIRLEVVEGKIARIDGPAGVVAVLNRLFDSVDSEKGRVLAECGIGLNPLADLTGIMLTDEGAIGTMHLGFGSNSTVGGENHVSFHLDFVMRSPTITADGFVILKNGECQL
jgi:2,5-dihydroxypyridine 5,6-dioxygenase